MRTRQVNRKRVEVTGQCCSVQGRVFDIAISDLTKGGCGFPDLENVLNVGTPVNLMISGTGPHHAHVRWKADGKVGVSFQRPLDAELLEQIVEGKVRAPQRVSAPAPSAPDDQDENGTGANLPLRRVC